MKARPDVDFVGIGDHCEDCEDEGCDECACRCEGCGAWIECADDDYQGGKVPLCTGCHEEKAPPK